MAYEGSIDLIAGIRPKNNGTFPLVDAKDVYVNDSLRLDAAITLTPVYSQTPTFTEWTFSGGTEGVVYEVEIESPVPDLYSANLRADGHVVSYATVTGTDIVSVTFTVSLASAITATRTRTDIIGYTLGDQTTKKLQAFGAAQDVVPLEETTWSALKNKRDSGELVPGQQYRITDYVATVANAADASSTGHPFDIIVVADAADMLNEVARAVRHSGDTHFPDSTKFGAWKVWYSIDNDTTRFAWANTTTGKGVVYRLIDEFNNDAPYDFKGIYFGGAGVYTFDTGNGTDMSLGGSVNNSHVGRTVDLNGRQILNSVIFSGALQNVFVESGCAYLEIINDSAGVVGNVTISSGIKGSSYNNSKTIRITESNMAYHTTYVPRNSQSIEV